MSTSSWLDLLMNSLGQHLWKYQHWRENIIVKVPFLFIFVFNYFLYNIYICFLILLFLFSFDYCLFCIYIYFVA
jgi:hypothetical protein